MLTPEALAALSADWLTTLQHGAQAADTTMLFEVIEQIRPHDTEVADALARLTNNFEYDTMLAVLQKTCEHEGGTL